MNEDEQQAGQPPVEDAVMNVEQNGNGHNVSEAQQCAIWPTISYLLSQQEDQAQQLNGVGAKLSDLRGHVSQNKLLIDGLTQQMTTLTVQLRGLQDQMHGVNSEVTAMHSDLSGHFTRQTATLKELETKLFSQSASQSARSDEQVKRWEKSTTNWWRLLWVFAAIVGGLGGAGLASSIFTGMGQ